MREASSEKELVSTESGAVEGWSEMAKSLMTQLTELLGEDGPNSFPDIRDKLEFIRQSFQTNVEDEYLVRSDGAKERSSDEIGGRGTSQTAVDDHNDGGDSRHDDGSSSSLSSEDSDSTSGGSTSSSTSSDSDLDSSSSPSAG